MLTLRHLKEHLLPCLNRTVKIFLENAFDMREDGHVRMDQLKTSLRPLGSILDFHQQRKYAISTIRQVNPEYDTEMVQDLFWEYLQWANSRNYEEFGIKLDITAMLKDDMDKLEIFSPPNGRLLLAFDGTAVAGLACICKMREGIGGIKRMYVLPSFRGRGIGRELLEGLIVEARSIGYSRIRLDSARYMKEAHSLYRSVGFKEIDEYPESEIPEEFRTHWIFMEKLLQERLNLGVMLPNHSLHLTATWLYAIDFNSSSHLHSPSNPRDIRHS